MIKVSWRLPLRSRLTAVIGLVLLLFSCDKIQENPLDPEGSDYTPPETFLTMEALEGSILDTSTVTITWSGNDLTVEYAYSLNDNWSEWSSATFVTLVSLSLLELCSFEKISFFSD